uniref:Uncharacterized protein n=1 Tax=Aegilops tauschii subsp. strangulata TaxID=200361 RepID=A0A453DEX8_AEGTS
MAVFRWMFHRGCFTRTVSADAEIPCGPICSFPTDDLAALVNCSIWNSDSGGVFAPRSHLLRLGAPVETMVKK